VRPTVVLVFETTWSDMPEHAVLGPVPLAGARRVLLATWPPTRTGIGEAKGANPVREPLSLRAEKSVSTRRRRLPHGGLAKVAFSSASQRSRRCHRVAGAEGTRDEAQESPLAGASL
jgi:hypothetical protein